MRTRLIFFALGLLYTTFALGQAKPVNLSDSAYFYYKKKDFVKAFDFYEAYQNTSGNLLSNYDAYYAAVSACHSGHPEQVAHYLNMSARVGYALTDYYTFADDPLNTCVREMPEWKKFIGAFKIKADSAAAAMRIITEKLNDPKTRVNNSLLSDQAYWTSKTEKKSASELLRTIQHFNQYPKLTATGHWTLYYLKANDTLTVPFLCYIPQNYKSTQKTALYVFLHGAAAGRREFANPAYEPDTEKDLFKRAFEQNAFILFPFSKKTYNWLEHQGAFQTVLNEVAYIKSLYNIDDNRIYMGGHSDGGRGAVWFAMNQPTSFAAFYGICYFPSLLTGNTPFRNLHNQASFYGISASSDKLFPLATVSAITQQARALGGHWKSFSIEGTHSLPYRSPESIYFVFDSLLTNVRDPLPSKIVWETDNIQNGRYFWVSIDRLDTATAPSSWHSNLAPSVMGKSGKIDFTKHKSGAISAGVANNVININTSCVKVVTIHLMSGLIDLKKSLTININGKNRFSALIIPDKNLIISEFLRTKDRTQILIKNLTFEIR